jgi:hypothetical protein
LAAEERRRRDGHVRPGQRPQRRELLLAELVEPNRLPQVLEPVLTEVAEVRPVEQTLRRLREDDLAAVGGRADARGAVNVDPNVALIGHGRLAGMDPHPDGDRERPLRFLRRRDRIGCARESDEEGIPLGIDLDAPVGRKGVAKCAAVLGQRVGIARAQLLEQPGRTLDIGEEEGDGAGRKLGHGPNDVPKPAV